MENQPIPSEETTTTEGTDKIIKNHVLGAMGVGLVPVPLVDLVALAGIQLNMLRRLAGKYDIPFSKDKGKHLIASLLGSGLSVSMGTPLGSAAKAIPIIGQTVGALTMPAVSAAATYAVGKVFIQHFESGGTFLDFDPEEVKAYYMEMLKEGRNIVSGMKQSATPDIGIPDPADGKAEEPETAAKAPSREDTETKASASDETEGDKPAETAEEAEETEKKMSVSGPGSRWYRRQPVSDPDEKAEPEEAGSGKETESPENDTETDDALSDDSDNSDSEDQPEEENGSGKKGRKTKKGRKNKKKN